MLTSDFSWKLVAERIARSPRYFVNDYHYFVWPYKGIEAIESNHLDIITDLLAKHVPKNTDLLMSFMTDGALLAVPVAIKLGLPVCIWRDYHYEMKDALTCSQVTGYYSRQLYCCKPHDGARICLLDAILSTGGTITAASKSLSEIATVVSVVVAAEKEKFGGRELVRNEVGVDPVAVFNVDIANEAIRVRFGSNLIEG